jgi:hypothetical protein
MKKLLIGLLTLGSISSFATEYQADFIGESIVTKKGETDFRILANERNADFFCLSKGFTSSVEFKSTRYDKRSVAYDILPNGSSSNGWIVPNTGTSVLNSVKCHVSVQK